MKDPKMKKILIIAVALVLIVVAIILIARGCGSAKKETNPTADTTAAESTTQGATSANSPIPQPELLPDAFTIPPETNPETGETLGIAFPYDLPDYGLKVEKLAPYTGMFLEDGSNREIENVAMIMLHNYGDFPLEYLLLQLHCGEETLSFEATCLPVGERVLVQEKTGKAIPENPPSTAEVIVIQGSSLELWEEKVTVEKTPDCSFNITNLTDETIETVRVYYKYYMEEEKVFVAGSTFTVEASKLEAGKTATVTMPHDTGDNCRVVMVVLEKEKE